MTFGYGGKLCRATVLFNSYVWGVRKKWEEGGSASARESTPGDLLFLHRRERSRKKAEWRPSPYTSTIIVNEWGVAGSLFEPMEHGGQDRDGTGGFSSARWKRKILVGAAKT